MESRIWNLFDGKRCGGRAPSSGIVRELETRRTCARPRNEEVRVHKQFYEEAAAAAATAAAVFVADRYLCNARRLDVFVMKLREILYRRARHSRNANKYAEESKTYTCTRWRPDVPRKDSEKLEQLVEMKYYSRVRVKILKSNVIFMISF